MCALQSLCGLKSQAKVLAYTSAGLPSGLNLLLSCTNCKETLTPVPAAQTYKACFDIMSTDSIAVIQSTNPSVLAMPPGPVSQEHSH